MMDTSGTSCLPHLRSAAANGRSDPSRSPRIRDCRAECRVERLGERAPGRERRMSHSDLQPQNKRVCGSAARENRSNREGKAAAPGLPPGAGRSIVTRRFVCSVRERVDAIRASLSRSQRSSSAAQRLVQLIERRGERRPARDSRRATGRRAGDSSARPAPESA